MAETPNQPQMSSAQIAEAIMSGDLASLGITAGKEKRTIGPSAETVAEATQTGALPPDFRAYEDGDQWAYGMDPTERARIKAYMSSAGLYGRGVARSGGGWTKEDAEAMAEVLAFANANGISTELEAAKKYAEMIQTEGPAAKAPREPLVTRMANPESVRQVIRRTSMELLGRRLSDQEEARLVSGFQTQDVGAQRAAYGQGAAGGQYTEALTAQEYAASQLEGTVEAGDQRYLDAFDKILQSATSTMVEGPSLTGEGGVRQ